MQKEGALQFTFPSPSLRTAFCVESGLFVCFVLFFADSTIPLLTRRHSVLQCLRFILYSTQHKLNEYAMIHMGNQPKKLWSMPSKKSDVFSQNMLMPSLTICCMHKCTIRVHVEEVGSAILNSQDNQHGKQENNQKSKSTISTEIQVEHWIT